MSLSASCSSFIFFPKARTKSCPCQHQTCHLFSSQNHKLNPFFQHHTRHYFSSQKYELNYYLGIIILVIQFLPKFFFSKKHYLNSFLVSIILSIHFLSRSIDKILSLSTSYPSFIFFPKAQTKFYPCQHHTHHSFPS